VRCASGEGREVRITTPTVRLLVFFAALPFNPGALAAGPEFQQRSTYLAARENLRQGRLSEFRKLAAQLDDYALRPYLDYHYLRGRISSISAEQLLTFVDANPDIPVAPLLHKRWMRELGKRRAWQTLRQHYRTTANAEIRCYYLRALYGTGDKEQALDETTAVWLQPVSQPKSCDPLFDVWRSTPRFSEAVVWQRFEASVMANQRTLARYLLRFLSGSNRAEADALYAVHVTPSRITRSKQFTTDNARYRTIIAHGISRLATRDADKAAKAWQHYLKSHKFPPARATRISHLIASARADQDSIFPSPAERGEFTQPDLIEDFASAALANQSWNEAAFWIPQLPPDIGQKSKWQYWRARSQGETGSNQSPSLPPYTSLAEQRHYYGFLAARRLGIPGRMNAVPTNGAGTVELTRIQRIPGIRRSVELFAVGDDLNGRREWFSALEAMPPQQQILAAELARHHGLISMSIRTANIAEATDYLHLRFPVVFEPQFRRASMKTTVGVPLLMALARQESAMEAQARSSADARGLMQLLPSTARLVARRARIKSPATADLYDPGLNIALGSYHIAWLLARYGGQTPLAIAAYNAGEHRVDRWIKEAQGMPMDVWIETIPFGETRNYVKNVLAFRHVYGEKLKTPSPVLAANEQFVGKP
jgi:soluble lytic murein transglycosylase